MSKVWRYGDHVDTDVIIPARYLNISDFNELAEHAMEDSKENLTVNFAANVKPGDIVVAGKNFGCGSSREHAPVAIKAGGVSCVIAKSFARIFYRNSINIGLPILECPEAVKNIKKGDVVSCDLSKGEIVNETITRQLSGPWDFLHTRIVNIYPDESCWVNDFNNAYNEPYMRMYFSHPGYDDYPVVGVSWEQATAFCVWRTNLFKESLNFPSGQAIEPFRLPTEGEWEYAARTGKNENKYPWAGDELVSGKGCFLGNFKPGKGNYTEDGHLITSRVGSFAPNEFGLYDMAGNVAEWTSTSYSESGPSQMSDMNPDLRYNAAKEDPYAMKKKVVRGGSWKDVAQFIRSDMRTFEYQNETRSYIGFRCARTQIGFSRAKGKK